MHPNKYGKLVELVKEETKKAEEELQRKIREVNFLATLVKENYGGLEKVFADKINSENPVRDVYDSVVKTIEELEDYANPIGIRIYRGKAEELKIPEVLLGWVELYGLGGKEGNYSLRLNQKGYDLVDKIRQIRGQPSIKEQAERAMSYIKKTNMKMINRGAPIV